MRRPKKAKETLALLYKVPWMGHQVIRSTRNPNAIIKSPCLWGQVKEKKEKEIKENKIKKKSKNPRSARRPNKPTQEDDK